MIGHWNVSLLAFGLVCVAGCMQESVWRGVMRSLDNFSNAASNNRWCEGAWPPQLAGTREGKRGWLIVWPCEDFSVLWNLRRKTWELQDLVKTRTTYFVWVVYLYALKGHSLHIDKTSQSVSGRRKPVHVTKWEETQKSCGGDLKKKKKRVIWRRPSQSAADWRFTQAGGAYNWLFVAVRGMNMCVCLRLPLPGYSTQTLTPNSCLSCFVFFHLHGKNYKT